MTVPEREEIDEEYKWNVDEVYSGLEEWEKDREKLEELLERIQDYRGEVTGTGEKLFEVLELYEKVMRKLQKLSRYASMKKDEDTRVQEYQSLYSRARSLSSKVDSRTSFIEPEILQAGERAKKLAEQEKLEKYRHYLDDVLRLAPHTRSEEVEEVLASLGEVIGAPGDIYQVFSDADLRFPEVEDPSGEKVEITKNNLTRLLRRDERSFRRKVHTRFFERMSEYRNTFSSTLENAVKADVRTAKIKNYDTAREHQLDQVNVPVEVYDNLLATVHDNLNVLHRHAELKKRHIGAEKIHPWDLYMPLSDEDPEVTYEEAREHVLEAVKPLGDGYVEKMREGLDSGWVDVYENRGKRSGAYSGGAYDTRPFILMNYQDSVDSMYTLAHELGHSMHSHFTTENQPFIYSRYPIFLAEIASTVNEMLLTEHLLENAENEALKKAAMSHVLENFRSTLFRQAMFADFEHRIHREVEEGGSLTADSLDETYGGLKKEFYRPVEVDEMIEREWMRIPHFYWSYYVFQYSTGISSAVAIAEKVINEGPEDYLEFLRAGSSDYPLKILERAGVDMATPSPIKEAISVYGDYLDRMEKRV